MGISEQSYSLNGRRILTAAYMDEAPKRVTLRAAFPDADTDYMGGQSDGLVYTSVFAGSTLEATYNMVREFLQEEGYHDVPLPADVGELGCFRLPNRNKQLLLFEDNGYCHNPVKVLFPLDRRKRTTLILKVYNEQADGHLLRFHNKQPL